MGLLDKVTNEDGKETEIFDQQKVHRFTNLYELMCYKLSLRDARDRQIFDHSVKGLSGLCAISSFYMNTIVRRSLMVYEGFVYSNFSIAMLSCTINLMSHYIMLKLPLLEGNLNCSACSMIRGGAVQAFSSCILPGLMSFSATAILAERYKSAVIPEFTIPPEREFKEFWKKIASTLKRRSAYMLVFQTLVGGYIGYRQHKIARDLRSSISDEEFSQLWSETASHIDFFKSL